jgi:hypothetical protein
VPRVVTSRSDVENGDGCAFLPVHNTLLRRISLQGSSASIHSSIVVLQTRTAQYPGPPRLLVISGPRVRGIPFVHLAASRTAHRNRNARQAFEQNPLSLQTGRDRCTRARALNQDVSQPRTPLVMGQISADHCQACIFASNIALGRIVRPGRRQHGGVRCPKFPG